MKTLPPGLFHKHGSYYLVLRGKWINLGRDEAKALAEYANRQSPGGDLCKRLDQFLIDAKDRKLAATTLAQYSTAVAKLKPLVVEFSPGQLKGKHVAAIMRHFKKTPNMANRVRTVLKMTMDEAVQTGEADANPVVSIKRFKEPARTRYLTHDEYRRIYAVASPRLQVIMDLLYLTGQRISDVLAIKPSQIEGHGIRFRQSKTDNGVVVSDPQLGEVLERARTLSKVRGISTLICTRRGRPLAYKTAYDMFIAAAKKAGVEDVTPHDLRAKAGTDGEQEGIDPQKLLGHKSSRSTERYLREKRVHVVSSPSLAKLSKSG
jgi:integrase